ncbi:hypothetical protein F5Y04DRAFT_252857 [Hypomontagnella monticulosa]|nr:hypothetical protein F5Y04DRAFT_252857 [Hypomontagnella monticulosa]
MVVSTANQLRSTYLLWQRFTYPSENGPKDAIAVPARVGDQLNSAYTIIIEMALVRFWSIIFGLILYLYLRRHPKPKQAAFDIWNKKADLDELVTGMFTSKKTWEKPGPAFILFLLFLAWVGQTATGVLVPPLILLGSAAPVNPNAIYLPQIPLNTDPTTPDYLFQTRLFSLEAPRFLRALGSTAVNEELRQKVNVDGPISIAKTENGEDIQRIDYSYSATGADFGLQQSPDLILNVSGSCVTDYDLFLGSEQDDDVDQYTDPTGQAPYIAVSPYDGRQPIATFFLVKSNLTGALPTSNGTWTAIISSVNKTSFSASRDPWYFTRGSDTQDTIGDRYVVERGRPALSCWQDDVWSYQGRKSTVAQLSNDALPGLNLPQAIQDVFASVLASPMVAVVGQHLQAGALLSSTTSNQELFDAGASSAYNDLTRLVQGAYVTTVNSLTDLTLYPPGAASSVPNGALNPSNQPNDGVGDFVVWSPDVAALDTIVVIVVPSVFLGVWVIANILMRWTGIGRTVKQLEPEEESDADESNDEPKPSAAAAQQSGSQGNQPGAKPNQGQTQTDVELGNNAAGEKR